VKKYRRSVAAISVGEWGPWGTSAVYVGSRRRRRQGGRTWGGGVISNAASK